MTEIDIRHGDCLTVLRTLPDNSVDSVVTDPPLRAEQHQAVAGRGRARRVGNRRHRSRARR